MRRAISIFVPAILVLALGPSALSAGTWLDPTAEHPRVGGRFTWNFGSAFAQTDDGKLHTVYATDHIGTKWATDSGPYVGTYYLRGSVGVDDAVIWSRPRRVSPTTRHAERPALEAEGTNVYVGYVTYKSTETYDPATPRVFYIRRNTDSGAADAWESSIRMSPRRGRVDYPVIAASGIDVYAVWTNGDTGALVFARSTDAGVNWTTSKIGATSRGNRKISFYGWPGICADGNLVGVAWLDDEDGRLSARVSVDGGLTFGGEQPLTTMDGDRDGSWPQCAAFDGADDRVAFAWTDHDRTWASIFTNSTESFSTVNVYDYDQTPYNGGFAPAPAFSPDGSKLGVAFTGCRVTEAKQDCSFTAKAARVDLLWREGAADGSTWDPEQLLATRSSGRPNALHNDAASIVWYDADTRFVTYNLWTPTWKRYEIALQTGQGV